jgi:hypothetical protein
MPFHINETKPTIYVPETAVRGNFRLISLDDLTAVATGVVKLAPNKSAAMQETSSEACANVSSSVTIGAS